MSGTKYDENKLRFDLIIPEFEEAMAKVLTHGAQKYGENNWQKVEGAKARYIAALQRHLNEYRKGYMYDPDSGCEHLAQIAVNAMFLHWFYNFSYRTNDANKILSGIDNRVLAAATGTKQDCATSREVDTTCESGFTPGRYE